MTRKELEKFKKSELIDFMVEEYHRVTEARFQLRKQLEELEAKQPEDLLTDLKEEIEDLESQLQNSIDNHDSTIDDLERVEDELEESEEKVERLESALEEKLNLDELEDLLDSLTVQYKHRFDSSQLSSLALNIPIIKQIIRFG